LHTADGQKIQKPAVIQAQRGDKAEGIVEANTYKSDYGPDYAGKDHPF